MRSSVADVTLKPCCRRSLRSICQEMEKGGISHALLSSGSLQSILNPNPAESSISVTLADWDQLVDEVSDLEEGACDLCSRHVNMEILRHGDDLGVFWRSLSDCFLAST